MAVRGDGDGIAESNESDGRGRRLQRLWNGAEVEGILDFRAGWIEEEMRGFVDTDRHQPERACDPVARKGIVVNTEGPPDGVLPEERGPHDIAAEDDRRLLDWLLLCRQRGAVVLVAECSQWERQSDKDGR